MSNASDSKFANFKVGKNGGVQHHGWLMKKPVGHKSTNWQKRFFVLKESFLFYYAETEKKAFKDKGIFNIHPKGVIPLGYCVIEDTTMPGAPYGININFPDNTNAMCLGAENVKQQEQWVKALESAAQLTHENFGMLEAMSKSLEEQNRQLSSENREMYDKFQKEAKDVVSEREQREVLELFSQQLLEEKNQISILVEELHLKQKAIKRELEETINSHSNLEKDRTEMMKLNKNLKDSLTEQAAEREKILKQLEESDEAKAGNEINVAQLRHQLDELTESMRQKDNEKNQVEEKLYENQSKLQEIAKEKEEISQDVDSLKTDLQELNIDKASVEDKLKKELEERERVQQELSDCKEALRRIEEKLVMSLSHDSKENVPDEESQQTSEDVQSLKRFFEQFLTNQTTSDVTRRYSRRFNQIKKLRLHQPNPNHTVPPVAHEMLSSTPGIEPPDDFNF